MSNNIGSMNSEIALLLHNESEELNPQYLSAKKRRTGSSTDFGITGGNNNLYDHDVFRRVDDANLSNCDLLSEESFLRLMTAYPQTERGLIQDALNSSRGNIQEAERILTSINGLNRHEIRNRKRSLNSPQQQDSYNSRPSSPSGSLCLSKVSKEILGIMRRCESEQEAQEKLQVALTEVLRLANKKRTESYEERIQSLSGEISSLTGRIDEYGSQMRLLQGSLEESREKCDVLQREKEEAEENIEQMRRAIMFLQDRLQYLDRPTFFGGGLPEVF